MFKFGQRWHSGQQSRVIHRNEEFYKKRKANLLQAGLFFNEISVLN